jgi:hypothetical protein
MSAGDRPCSKVLTIYPVFVDGAGSQKGKPFWWCSKHGARSDPEGLARIDVEVVAGTSGREAQRIIVRTASYRGVIL